MKFTRRCVATRWGRCVPKPHGSSQGIDAVFCVARNGVQHQPMANNLGKDDSKHFFDTKVGKTEPKVSEDGKPPIQ